MSITHFAGVPAGAIIALSDYEVLDVAVGPAVAFSKLTIQADGDLGADGNPNPNFIAAEWSSDKRTGLGDAYECRATLVSGPAPAGDALNTWLPLTVSRSWSQEQTGIGSQLTVIDVDIGFAGVNSPIVTGRESLNVEVI